MVMLVPPDLGPTFGLAGGLSINGVYVQKNEYNNNNRLKQHVRYSENEIFQNSPQT